MFIWLVVGLILLYSSFDCIKNRGFYSSGTGRFSFTNPKIDVFIGIVFGLLGLFSLALQLISWFEN